MSRPRIAIRLLLAIFSWMVVMGFGPRPLLAQPTPGAPPKPAVTKEQQEKLKERDQLEEEIKKLRALGKLAEAISRAQKIVAIERQVLGNVQDDLADSLALLADLQEEQEDFPGARKAREEVLALRTKLHGNEHWMVSDAQRKLLDLARLAKLSQDDRKLLKEARRLKENLDAHYESGQYREGIKIGTRIQEIQGRVRGDKHPDYAASLSDLALLYTAQGDYARAEPLFRQALHIEKQVLGDKHPDHATSLNNLAALYHDQGDYALAEPIFRQALGIRKQALGDKHPDSVVSLNNLAVLYHTQGDYARAEPLYRQALGIRKQTLGDKHPDYATSLNNLAQLYWTEGDYARAEPLYRQALDIRKQTLGDKHPDYATSLNNLAVLYNDQGDYARAEPLYRHALDICKQTLGDKHADYGQTLNNLASLCQDQGDYARAQPLFRQASDICKQALGDKHPEYATGLTHLAGLYQDQGDYARAEPLYRQASDIWKQALGDKHPDYAWSLNKLARLYYVQGNFPRAEPRALHALNIVRANLDLAAGAQSERQQLAMSRSLSDFLDLYLSVTAEAPKSNELVYAQVFTWKGAVQARQGYLRLGRQQPELAPDFEQLRSVSSRLATLAFAAPDPKKQAAYRRQMEELTLEKERLEAELSAKSALFRQQRAQARRTPAQLQEVLPAGTALVDFLEYIHFSRLLPEVKAKCRKSRGWRLSSSAATGQWPESSWGKWILSPCAVDEWRKSYGSLAPGKASHPGSELRRLVWEKLESHLQDAQTVLISPDGALARCPWAALPGKEPESYLIEERALAVVAVPQLLPELLAPREATAGSASLLAVGEVDYGAVPGRPVQVAERRSAPRGGFRQFEPLAGTAAEIAAIERRFQHTFPDAKVTELTEGKATEGALRQQAPEYRYLHIATHGYFAPPEVKSALAALSRGAAETELFGGRREASGFHPGLLSGIVLAGANQRVDVDSDDGILTALEVSTLDLGKVELATLSACETGLGEVAGGEGVLGLQRAFQVAGRGACWRRSGRCAMMQRGR